LIDLLDIRHVRLGTRDRLAADRFAREGSAWSCRASRPARIAAAATIATLRCFPAVPSSFAMWGSLPDIPEFRKDPA
jgi:hypothetical protein